MKTLSPPELADGGYWYVREAVPEAVDVPGWTAGNIVNYAAWYKEVDGIMYCVIRVLQPAALPMIDIDISNILAGNYRSKPFARIKGR